MKKSLFTTLFLLVCTLLAAEPVNRQQAQQKAAALFGANTPMQLVATGGDEEDAYYVFNAQRAEKGFAIVAGDDRSSHILGYSENGEMDMNNLPPQLAFWLECYKEQIERIRMGQAETYKAPIIHEEIAPLVRTHWDQDEPYNSQLPELDSGERCAAGCVATAMAQILKYWAAPFQTTDIPAYTTKTKEFEMPELPATTFNYDIMQDEYSASDTGEAVDEVARLILYCGQAANMDYNLSSSATASGVYFGQYFGMNPNYKDAIREDYSCFQWDELIYNELANSRPVIYSGGKHTNAGHSFIVDGYLDGLYHINWGWSGYHDGYFKLSEANPNGGGTGSGSGNDGYSFRQKALIRIQPEAIEPTESEMNMTVRYLSASETNYTRELSSEDFTVPITFTVWNYTGGNLNDCYTGIGVYQGEELVKVAPFSHNSFEPEQGFNKWTKNVSFGSEISSGTFVVKAVCRLGEDGEWQEDINSDKYQVKLTIDGDVLTAESPIYDMIVVNDVTFDGTVKMGKQLVARANITNLGVNVYNKTYLFANDELMTGSGVYLDQYESDEVVYHFAPPAAGLVNITIGTSSTGGGDVLWSGTLNVQERHDPNLKCEALTVSNVNNNELLGTTMTVTANVKNLDTEEDFDDQIIFRLFKLKPGTNTGYENEKKVIDVVIPINETKDVEVSFEDLLIGSSYWVSAYVYKPSTNQEIKMKQTYTYKVVEDPSGIRSISVDDANRTAPVYDLQGRFVGTTVDVLPHGLYIVNGKKVIR